jgi:putative membrane protein
VDTLDLLVGTVGLRPYVFAFLAAFLSIALAEIGPWRTLVWTVLGYAIAFACEWSSTRNGFPFGLYHYLDAATRGRELWISNVPFMDSLSFVFLSFVSFSTARRLLRAPARPDGRVEGGAAVIALAAVLMTAIDLVCDPVSLRGDRWFLGRIYYYAEPGAFFGVPLSNFVGWTLLAVFIVGAMRGLERVGVLRGAPLYALPRPELFAPGLYLGIVLFNAAIAFWIGLAPLGWLGLAIAGGVALGCARSAVPVLASAGLEEVR